MVLGDSLASGTNLGPRVPGSYAACGQTLGSYPQLAKTLIQPTTFVDSSCNGGHTGVMWYSWWGLDAYIIDPAERVEIPPQFDSLNGTEDAVIVGTGGNEAYFGEVAFACMGYQADQQKWYSSAGSGPFHNNCTKTYVNPGTGYNRLRDKVAGSETAVTEALAEVKRRSPQAKIFLIGTPRIAPPNGANCMPNPILTTTDAPVYAVWEDELRLAMKRGASAVGATYVDMQALGGTDHTMCSPPAARWMNPWSTEAVQYPGLALHNTPLGAQETAKAITDAFRTAGLDVPTGPTGPTGGTGPAAPDVARTNPVANPTTSRTQAITYSGVPGNTLLCKLDSQPYASCSGTSITLNNLPTGTHTYSVTQTAPGGAVSPAGSVTWVVEPSPPGPPTVTRTIPTANPTKSTTQTITYSGEAGGTFQCKLDGVTNACSGGTVVLSGLLSGPHTYSVTQTDAHGELGSATTVSWTVDLEPPAAPTVTRTSPSETPTTSTDQTISYGGFESGGTFQCKLDNEPFGPCPASPVTFTGQSDGPHTASFTHTDQAGNVSPVQSVTWTVDTLAPGPPIVTRTAPTVNPTSSRSQTIRYVGEPGGTYACKLDDIPIGACPSSPVAIAGLSFGNHTFSVQQTDSLGHVGAAGTVVWTVAPVPEPVPRTGPAEPAVPTGSTSGSTNAILPITAKLSSVGPKKLVPARSGKPFSLKRRRSAGSFRVTLSKSAKISVRLERVVRKRSRAATPWTKLKLKSGRTRIYLSGRTNRRALKPGTYRVRVKINGVNQSVFSKSFRIKR